jgi:thiamine kinase-like enzyme
VSFLKELHEKTQQECSFENTNFAKSIDYLATHTGLLGKNDVPYILEAITKVKAYFAQSERVNFSVYHGDFTPWNMFFEQGKLFVFDWEYAQMTYPPHLDSFHFFTQCCIFEQHLKSEEIYKLYTQRNPKLINYIENPDFYYICYLLDIISFYLKRNDDKKHNSINTSMAIWLKLITILVQQI